MKIIGKRVLVSRIEEEKKSEFQVVDATDKMWCKGLIEQMNAQNEFKVGDKIIFAKYSPDTQDIEHEGKKMKIVKFEDIIAVL